MINNSIRLPSFFILALLSVGFGFVLPPLVAALMGIIFLVSLVHFFLRLNVADFLALPKSRNSWIETLIAFAFGLIFLFLLQVAVKALDPKVTTSWSTKAYHIILVVPFQAFFEEILFRGVFLKNLFFRSKAPKWLSLVAMAVVFSMAHDVNYSVTENQHLSVSALVGLFLLGFAGNVVFLRQGHLGGAWGFHAGWNTLRYAVLYQVAGNPVSEGESFNILEGSWVVVLFGILLSAALLLFVRESQPPAANANLYPR